jgi:hypothetical protein
VDPPGESRGKGLGVCGVKTGKAQGVGEGSCSQAIWRGTHLLRGQQADIDEVPVIGHKRHHFKGQVRPWILRIHRENGKTVK